MKTVTLPNVKPFKISKEVEKIVAKCRLYLLKKEIEIEL